MQIRQAIAWYADDDSGQDGDIRDAAKRVLAALHTELPDRVAHFVKTPWGNLRHRDRETSAERTDIATTFVAHCLRGVAAQRLILADTDFVTILLSDAAAVGSDTLGVMEDALFRGVVSGTTSQKLRDEIERRASEARDRLPIVSRGRDLYGRTVAEVQRINLASRAGDDDTEEASAADEDDT